VGPTRLGVQGQSRKGGDDVGDGRSPCRWDQKFDGDLEQVLDE